MKTPTLYAKGELFEPQRRIFFTATVVLLSFNKPEKVLWTIAKILLYILYYEKTLRTSQDSDFQSHFSVLKIDQIFPKKRLLIKKCI